MCVFILYSTARLTLPLCLYKNLVLYPAVYGAHTELYCGFSPELTTSDNGRYVSTTSLHKTLGTLVMMIPCASTTHCRSRHTAVKVTSGRTSLSAVRIQKMEGRVLRTSSGNGARGRHGSTCEKLTGCIKVTYYSERTFWNLNMPLLIKPANPLVLPNDMTNYHQ